MADITPERHVVPGGACVAPAAVVLLGALLLGTVLAGPAAHPAPTGDLADPFVAPGAAGAGATTPAARAPAKAGDDLRDPFRLGRADRPNVRAPRNELRDPFAPTSAGERAAQKRTTLPASASDLAGPFAGVSAAERAAQRVEPLPVANTADLRDPFAAAR